MLNEGGHGVMISEIEGTDKFRNGDDNRAEGCRILILNKTAFKSNKAMNLG